MVDHWYGWQSQQQWPLPLSQGRLSHPGVEDPWGYHSSGGGEHGWAMLALTTEPLGVAMEPGRSVTESEPNAGWNVLVTYGKSLSKKKQASPNIKKPIAGSVISQANVFKSDALGEGPEAIPLELNPSADVEIRIRSFRDSVESGSVSDNVFLETDDVDLNVKPVKVLSRYQKRAATHQRRDVRRAGRKHEQQLQNRADQDFLEDAMHQVVKELVPGDHGEKIDPPCTYRGQTSVVASWA